MKWGLDDSTRGIQCSLGWSWGAWLTLRPPYRLLRRLRFPRFVREFSLRWNFGELDLHVFSDSWGRAIGLSDNEHRITLWRNEWVTGRYRHELREFMTTAGIVRCGEWEGDEYPVIVTLEERTWRNRFHTKRQVSYAMSVPDGGIAPPFPGKGENAWDCGEDGIYAMGADASCGSVEAACAVYAARTIENRRRYGGKNWKPAALKEQEGAGG